MVNSFVGGHQPSYLDKYAVDPNLPPAQQLDELLQIIRQQRWWGLEGLYLEQRLLDYLGDVQEAKTVEAWLCGEPLIPEQTRLTALINAQLLFGEQGVFWKYISALFEQGRFSYFLFYRLVACYQERILQELENDHSDLMPDLLFQQMKHDYLPRLRQEAPQDFSEIGRRVLNTLKPPFEGSEYLLGALRLMSVQRIGKLSAHQSTQGCRSDRLGSAVAFLAINTHLPDSEDRAHLVEQLRRFPPEHLEKLLGVGVRVREVLCQALGWDDLIPLVRVLDEVQDLAAILDTPLGLQTLADLLKILAVADQDRVRRLLKKIEAAFLPNSEDARLLLTALGDNRAEVLRKLAKTGNERFFKPYALLPLQDDLLERYQFFAKERGLAKKLQGKTRIHRLAEVQIALNCLALRAGYPNAARLEWALEGVSQHLNLPQVWQVGEYRMELVQEGIAPILRFSRKGKALKNTPSAIRPSPEYEEAKTRLEQLRFHAQELRNEVLERFISSGEVFMPDELETWLNIPLAVAMLENLLFFLPENGFIGRLDAQKRTLTDLAGKTLPLTSRFMLAHPLHLFEANALGGWQRYITQNHLTQPIKQVYRELYILTPAELETQVYSNRFAGHSLQGRQLSKWVAWRGWGLRGRYGLEIVKRFPQYGVQGVMSLPDARFTLWDTTTTDQIYFLPDPYRESLLGVDNMAHRIPLAEISPLIFSEVMRDVDHFVTEATILDGKRLSPEFYQKRRELVADLVDDLGLAGVSVAGEQAHIEGKLAKYRLHLGTGVIHIEPGNYLCIVPSRWGEKNRALYLPFADEDDPKTSEVISKLLMLHADDHITDTSILWQINRHRG